MKEIKISRSQIERFIECPRCFWLEAKHKIKRPEGIKGGYIGSKYDSKLKSFFDNLRLNGGVLEELNNHNLTLFPDLEKLKIWRNKGIEFYHKEHGFIYYGRIDDLLITKEGFLAPFDYKVTISQELKIYEYEKRQLEIYSYLFNKIGMDVSDIGVIYKIKVDIDENFEKIEERKFFIEKISYSIYDDILENLKEIYFSEKEPEPNQKCEYCKWYLQNIKIKNKIR